MGTTKRFRVALSFPGEQRDTVARVAEHLARTLGRKRVLYDAWYEAEFARPDLDTYLQALYHDESDLIAVFLCADYERKEWCGLEWRAVKDLIKRRQATAVMPLRFDMTEIPGLFSTDGYVWAGDGRDPGEIAELILQRWRHNGGVLDPDPVPVDPPRIDLSHLPAGAPHFLGREAELAELDTAWDSARESNGGTSPITAIVELVAPGGTGKTALVKRWVDRLRNRGWGGVRRVFAWSFYSQGTRDDRQASEDHFLTSAIDWFGVEIEPSANPADKGRALAEALTRTRTLLILDGLEPLQYPPWPLAGELRAPGLKSILSHLAGAGTPGLCVLNTRERVKDLAEWVLGPTNPKGPVLCLDLGNLSEIDGARLLYALGARKAGAAAIPEDDPELMAASREVRGHALTLSLLGNYLRLAFGGDIRRRDQVELADADEETGGHAFRVIAAYERWLTAAGADSKPNGQRQLAALRLLGFFDRPADPEDLAALRSALPIPDLTEALFLAPKGASDNAQPDPEPIYDSAWRTALIRLADAGLLAVGDEGQIDAHPLVREYLAAALKERNPDAFREGHRRLFERLKTAAPYRPEGLEGLQPLYRAVAHGCMAGRWQDSCDQVYVDRILRGTEDDGYYSGKALGAIGADLGAVACLFEDPCTCPVRSLSEPTRTWLLNEAATSLHALGRLEEALAPMQAGAKMAVQEEDWVNAPRCYGNLSELELTLGRLAEAVKDARRTLDYAEHSRNSSQRMSKRTTLVDALHQSGETAEASRLFAEAEALQQQRQPQYPLLYSPGGFRYCDLLLAGAERAAWRVGVDDMEALTACAQAERRARGAQRAWREIFTNPPSLMDSSLDQLTLARCALYADLVRGRAPNSEARSQAEQALDLLRAAGSQDHIPRGLLTRAWVRHAAGDPDGARADLDEAERIAARGSMRLHLADCALYRARLFRDRAALAEARRLIEACGYRRRLPELEDAERAAPDWPNGSIA